MANIPPIAKFGNVFPSVLCRNVNVRAFDCSLKKRPMAFEAVYVMDAAHILCIDQVFYTPSISLLRTYSSTSPAGLLAASGTAVFTASTISRIIDQSWALKLPGRLCSIVSSPRGRSAWRKLQRTLPDGPGRLDHRLATFFGPDLGKITEEAR